MCITMTTGEEGSLCWHFLCEKHQIIMNFTKLEFVCEDLNLNMYQKIMVGFVWFLVVIVGNIMLYGLIQFERNGGDPLKRRIIDQVSNILYYLDSMTLSWYRG